jgi:hypothetical protein
MGINSVDDYQRSGEMRRLGSSPKLKLHRLSTYWWGWWLKSYLGSVREGTNNIN